MQNFFVRELWNEWQVRVIVLLSLSLQILLIIYGSRRKYTAGNWIRILVWSAYLSADWVATVALGNLANSLGGCDDNSPNPNHYLQAFWAPFLLLHLGGPDNITAYSLEDNELWLRHFLELVVQVGVAFYIFVRSWSNNALTFIAIPMFIVGIIKYGERTWVLRSSSTKYFRKSLLSAPDPGLDFDEFVDQNAPRISTQHQNINPHAHYLYLADYLFKRVKYLFANLILGHKERNDGYTIMHIKTTEDAFKMVEIELGFMYDILYTKAIIVYSQLGIFLRCISTSSTICALISFSVIIGNGKHAYPITDISITYVLLVGAVVLEVYAFLVLIFSDWTKVGFIKLKGLPTNPTPGATSPHSHMTNHKSWSRSMAQHNLLSFCLKDKPMKCFGVQKLFCIKESLEKYQYMSWEEVNVDLQVLIFMQLLEKANKIREDLYDIRLCKELLAQRGNYVLEKSNCLNEFKWTTVEVEFDHSLFLWHIATNLCYYNDLSSYASFPDSRRKISKLLSDYMLYLLIICPFMLPSGIGEKRYKDTCAEAMRIFDKQGREVISDYRSACFALLQMDTNRSLEDLKGDESKSVLLYGCKLSKQLQLLESREGWGYERKWKMISEVWVEMLAYAASHCGWKEHAQQLRKGGELLTHVCLLMTHLGLSKQYQTQNHIQNSESDTRALERALDFLKVLQLENPDSMSLLKNIEQAIEQAVIEEGERERKRQERERERQTLIKEKESEREAFTKELQARTEEIEKLSKSFQALTEEREAREREKKRQAFIEEREKRPWIKFLQALTKKKEKREREEQALTKKKEKREIEEQALPELSKSLEAPTKKREAIDTEREKQEIESLQARTKEIEAREWQEREREIEKEPPQRGKIKEKIFKELTREAQRIQRWLLQP